jgi:hypothetical protein
MIYIENYKKAIINGTKFKNLFIQILKRNNQKMMIRYR